MQSTETVFNHRLWTVEEYHRMAKTGILDEDEPVELLEGRIIWMSAKGTAHSSAVARIYKLLQKSLGEDGTISPLQFPDVQIEVAKMLPPQLSAR